MENILVEKINKLHFVQKTANRKAIYLCDCGNLCEKFIKNVKRSTTRSCGCLDHGYAGTIIYSTWVRMKNRCNDPKDKQYKHYGGRGIKVCDRWLDYNDGFLNFLEDMGKKPEGKYSIGRKDNDGNYCKENCRWETDIEQNRNKRNTKYIECDGVTRPLTEWCEITGIKISTLRERLRRGWSPKEALFGKVENGKHIYFIDNEFYCISQLSKKYNIPPSTIRLRLSKNMTIEQALKI